MTEPVLVMAGEWNKVAPNDAYAVTDELGDPLAGVRDRNASTTKHIARFPSGTKRYGRRYLDVVDHTGAVLLTLLRYARVNRDRAQILDPLGAEIGWVERQVLDPRAALRAGGAIWGWLESPVAREKADDGRRYVDYRIIDHTHTEVAVVTNVWESTHDLLDADSRWVRIHRPLEEPMRSLTVGGALCLGTAFNHGPTSTL